MGMQGILARAATIGSAAMVILGVGLVPQASAAEKCVSTTGAKVCWQSKGDDFYISDTKADGRRAVVEYYTDRGTYGWCYNANGAGTTRKCDLQLEEPDTIYFYAGTCNGACTWEFEVYNRSPWVQAAV